jgi:archaellum biogenesis protein FlaJ (TadC family)
VVLAILLAMQDHPPGPWVSAITVAGTVLVVLAAEVYAELLGEEIDLGRVTTKTERRARLRRLAPITLSAEAPVVVLVLAGLGLFEEDTAFNIAIWVTVCLITVEGYLARRLAGRTVLASMRSAATLGALGVLLAVLKQLSH